MPLLLQSSPRPYVILLAALLTLGLGPPAAAQYTVNNGLAPPTPENVRDASDPNFDLRVLNEGCASESPSCTSTVSTTVGIVDGGLLPTARVYHSSILQMQGGTVSNRIEMHHQSYLEMSGGSAGLRPDWGYNDGVLMFDDSTALMTGGLIELSAQLYDQSHFTMQGGTITEEVWVWDDAFFAMSGGQIGIDYVSDGIIAYGGGEVEVSGTAQLLNLRGHAGSTVTMSGGVVQEDFSVNDSSGQLLGGTVNKLTTFGSASLMEMSSGIVREGVSSGNSGSLEISGGSVAESFQANSDGVLILRGGSLAGYFYDYNPELHTHSAGQIQIHGADFAVDGVPVPYGALDTSVDEALLTGRLEANEKFELNFQQDADIVLISASPVFESYSTGIFTRNTPTESLFLSGDAELNVDNTTVDYLEMSETSTGSFDSASVRGHLSATDHVALDLTSTDVEGTLHLQGATQFSFSDGAIGIDLELSETAGATLTDAIIGRGGFVKDSAELVLVRTIFTASWPGLDLSEQAHLELEDSTTSYIELFDDATLLITGDSEVLGWVWLEDTSSALIEGGLIKSLKINGPSRVVMNGGRVENFSTFDVTAGTYNQPWADFQLIEGQIDGNVDASMASTFLVAGGSIGGDLAASHYSTVELRGGELGGRVVSSWPDATVEIYGSGFQIDGTPAPDGAITETYAHLTGTLENGDALDVYIQRYDDGVILLPEPGRHTLLLSGLMALITLNGMRRRRADRTSLARMR